MARVEFMVEALSFLSSLWDSDMQLHGESGISLDFAFYKSA